MAAGRGRAIDMVSGQQFLIEHVCTPLPQEFRKECQVSCRGGCDTLADASHQEVVDKSVAEIWEDILTDVLDETKVCTDLKLCDSSVSSAVQRPCLLT